MPDSKMIRETRQSNAFFTARTFNQPEDTASFMLVNGTSLSSLELAVFVPALNLGQFLQHLFNYQRSRFDQLASANWTPFALILERPMTVAAKAVTVFTL